MISRESLQRFIKDQDVVNALYGMFDTLPLADVIAQRRPARFVAAHYVKYLKNTGILRCASRNGLVFEALVYEVLVRNTVSVACIDIHVDFNPKKRLEVDMVVCDEYALMCKSSVRERWAQWDRTAILIKRGGMGPKYFYGVHGVEQHKDISNGKEYQRLNVALCTKVQKQTVGLDGVVSIFADALFNDLIWKIAKCANGE